MDNAVTMEGMKAGAFTGTYHALLEVCRVVDGYVLSKADRESTIESVA